MPSWQSLTGSAVKTMCMNTQSAPGSLERRRDRNEMEPRNVLDAAAERDASEDFASQGSDLDVAIRSADPSVSVMQSADPRYRNDAPVRARLHGPRLG